MSEAGLLRKDQLERSLLDEKKLIKEGILKEDNPLDVSEKFVNFCSACRRGDLKVCQELIQEGVNINAKDQYDYTPLILSLGHYVKETHFKVKGAVESAVISMLSLTVSGLRCLYNALNDRIRNLLLSYDFSKSTDPLQPLASHLISLLSREQPRTSDITVASSNESFHLHKFILSARSPYFERKLASAPETASWKLPMTLPPQSFSITLKHIYLGELPRELGGGPGTGFTDSEILAGIDRISKHLEISSLSQLILDSHDKRLARQRRQDEITQGRDQLESWFLDHVLKHTVTSNSEEAGQIRWDRDNAIFADILLRADEDEDGDFEESSSPTNVQEHQSNTNALGIPIDPTSKTSRSPSRSRKPRRSKLYPCHKAVLIRSEYFLTMFDSDFREAQDTPHLQIIPMDCSPEVLEIILKFLYTEKAEFGLDIAVDVLFAADMLFLEKVKAKAAVVISTLGNGTAAEMSIETTREDEDLDIYEILHAAWFTRVQRLEEFVARYIANRLESYIDEPEFAEIIRESAGRISGRQETDSIELLDDIRYYLSERFRLRFEDSGLEDVMEETQSEVTSNNTALTENHETQSPNGTPAVNVGHDKALESKATIPAKGQHPGCQDDEGVDVSTPAETHTNEVMVNGTRDTGGGIGVLRTLDGEIAGDEFAADAVNYQILLGKIDTLLEKLKLDG